MQEDINSLVNKAKNGDSEAFGRLYDSFAQRIFKYIRLKVQVREQAEDILQEVFIKAFKGLNGLSMEGLNFSAWLYKIAGNAINDYFRKKYRTPDITPIDENFDIADSFSLQEDLEIKSSAEEAHRAFNEISPLCRQVLELRYVQGLSLNEVAKILGKTNLAVRLLQFRGLRQVRVILSDKQL